MSVINYENMDSVIHGNFPKFYVVFVDPYIQLMKIGEIWPYSSVLKPLITTILSHSDSDLLQDLEDLLQTAFFYFVNIKPIELVSNTKLAVEFLEYVSCIVKRSMKDFCLNWKLLTLAPKWRKFSRFIDFSDI